jgi:hypothetical protein
MECGDAIRAQMEPGGRPATTCYLQTTVRLGQSP